MNKVLLAIGAVAFSALLVPGEVQAQRGGHGGFGGGGFGGGGFRGGGFGGGGFRGGGFGGGGFRGGGFGGGGPRMFIPPGGGGGFRGGMGGLTTGSIAVARPGRSDFGMGAIGRPGYGFGYGARAPYYRGFAGAYSPYNRGYYGRYPYYGRYGYGRYPYYRGYPYYGGALAAGLALGALSYPYYGYGYYGYNYPYYGYYPNYYQTSVASVQDCYWIRRRIVGRNGHVFIRREQVCNY